LPIIFFDDSGVTHTIQKPSVHDVEQIINALDNEKRTNMRLDLPKGILSVVGGLRGRVVVSFNGRGERGKFPWGKLVDSEYSREDGELDISYDGDITPVPLYLTIPKAVALSVALHYFQTGTFPPHLKWEGNMAAFQQ
jgi:hypothetical protein